MRRGLFAVLAACSFPVATGTALAAGPVPEGTVATVKFRVAVQEKSAAQFSSTAIARVLNAQCTMVASPAMQVSFTGPTAEQEAEAQASASQAETMAQPNADLATKMAAEAEKCGDDEACLTAMVMQLSQNPEFLAEQDNLKASAKDALAAQPNLGPVRYQQWHPQSCTGELQVNDTYVTSDPGGEGGDGAYTDTVTVSATGAVNAGSWLGLLMETDTVKGATQYRIIQPAPISFPSNSSINGAGSVAVSLLGSTALPDVLGPYPGLTGGHKGTVKGKNGSISLEWSAAQ